MGRHMDVNLNNKYKNYCFHCFCEGDIWNIDNRPYTFEEWLNNKCPQYGGIPIK